MFRRSESVHGRGAGGRTAPLPAAGRIRVVKWLRQLDQGAERFLLLVFYTLVVGVVVVEVGRRYLLNYSSLWGEEIARYGFIYLSWIAASAAVKNRSHIRIDVVDRFVPARHHVWLRMFADGMTLIFSGYALYASVTPLLTAYQFGSVTDGLRVSRLFFLVAVPIGFVLIIVRLVQSIVRDFQDHAARRPLFAGKCLFE